MSDESLTVTVSILVGVLVTCHPIDASCQSPPIGELVPEVDAQVSRTRSVIFNPSSSQEA
jgi:hypothetical protein